MVHSPTALRRRKKTNAGSKSSSKVGDQPKLDPSGNRPALPPSQIYSVASLVCCILVAVASGAFLAYYAHMSQENFLWFSKLQEVEREISMRTERGLYYSYYKQLVHAPSIAQGNWNGITFALLESFKCPKYLIVLVKPACCIVA
uniref:Uncharacterized protein n=1 Tax=Trichuris muris TaxID=70415 RepID=A0A5S6Q1N0_TRIMR